ncbi:hypothetical protein STENOSP10_15160 [Stenotrophomonas sepilia]|uniref:Uncharacterized protein n=1 Tax=Stenotrophomonas sepilia TaxID=2860290 RepID=A0ABQ6QAR7_9GAMM|nr:hypothetical protein STENOSP10_15160 [Stenotrophomonas sepilia]
MMADSSGICWPVERLDPMLGFGVLHRMVMHRNALLPASGKESKQSRWRARTTCRPSRATFRQCTRFTPPVRRLAPTAQAGTYEMRDLVKQARGIRSETVYALDARGVRCSQSRGVVASGYHNPLLAPAERRTSERSATMRCPRQQSSDFDHRPARALEGGRPLRDDRWPGNRTDSGNADPLPCQPTTKVAAGRQGPRYFQPPKRLGITSATY